MAKSVRFSTAPSSSYSYPRVEAADIQSVYYQEEDYLRFRKETWLRAMRAQKRQRLVGNEQLNKESCPSQQEAMQSLGLNKRAKVQRQGTAQAA